MAISNHEKVNPWNEVPSVSQQYMNSRCHALFYLWTRSMLIGSQNGAKYIKENFIIPWSHATRSLFLSTDPKNLPFLFLFYFDRP